MYTAVVYKLPVSWSKERCAIGITSRLAIYQVPGRFASMLPLAVQVAQQLQTGSRTTRSRYPLGLHPEYGVILVAPLRQQPALAPPR
jgi:hypothetical protein